MSTLFTKILVFDWENHMNNHKLSINGKISNNLLNLHTFIENWEMNGEKLIHGNVDNNGKMCSVTMN